MNFNRWQDANNSDLARRLAWLRERFAQLIAAQTQSDADDTCQAAEDDCMDREDDVVDAYETDETEETDEAVDEAVDAADGDEHVSCALDLLAERLQLSTFECHVLLLCAAMEFDPAVPRMCAMAQSDASRPYPTFALAMRLFDDPAWDALAPERPLRYLKLIEISQPGHTTLTAAALRADERIVNYLKGLNYLDDRLTPLLLPFDTAADVTLPPSQQLVVDDVIAQLEQATGSGQPDRLPLVQWSGADAASKQLIAQQVAAVVGTRLLRLPVEMIPNDFIELETLLRLWDREARLLPISLYVDAFESDASLLERPASAVCRFLARASGLIFIDTNGARHAVGRPSLLIDVVKPTADEQRDLWRALIEAADDGTGHVPGSVKANDAATQLASQFSLNATMIHRIAQAGVSTYERANDVTPATPTTRLWNACRRATRPRLESLAQRIDARATWDDLVLPPDEASQLRDVATQIRHRGQVYDDWGFRTKHNRGLGVSVLFAGDSGTGKTMAAEVIANELQLDLYRIDLSAVVNKYIGETEKNLRRLFDAADDSGAILFFDEADSLFGTRTEVKDSHDRYANLEVNYLLQRMESYRGLAILASNLKSSLDTAFLRRLRFIVNFPIPDTAQRRELWRKAFPAETPLAPLDLDRLARLSVTGGNIHTIALNAAFASANDSPQLSMPHILKAARAEFRKLQKPINAADFRSTELEGERPMNVNLHIDSIVLDGIDLAPGDDRLLQQLVSRELTTLLSRDGLAASQRNVSELGTISGGTIRLGATGTTSLGQQMAHSIHQGLEAANSPASTQVGGPK